MGDQRIVFKAKIKIITVNIFKHVKCALMQILCVAVLIVIISNYTKDSIMKYHTFIKTAYSTFYIKNEFNGVTLRINVFI